MSVASHRTVDAGVAVDVPAVIRGRVITNLSVEHNTGDVTFRTPDPRELLAELPLRSRTGLDDLHALTMNEIVDFLVALGARLDLDRNEHLQQALALTTSASNLTAGVVREIYANQLAMFFQAERIWDAIDRRLGRAYLEGWVHEPSADGRDQRIRAFGARTAHVVAGNGPGVSAQTIVRNAITRSDAIIKTPSNDPITAVAIVRTMIDLDAEHPLTKHVSALHWSGGDETVERVVFSHPNVDKIVAWGGVSAIKHVAKYVGPGIELIALDPKISLSILGRDVLTDARLGVDAARRLALDVGVMNQEACVSSRVAYILVDGIDDTETAVRAFAQRYFDALVALDPAYSTPVTSLPAGLRDEIEVAALVGDPEVVGGATGAGGALISWDGRPVDYTAALAARYVNIVPVPDVEAILEHLSSASQTCGVFPTSLRMALRDRLALAGVQRVKDLGSGAGDNQAIPQDGIEVLRRMCRWIVDEGEPPATAPG